MIDRWAVIASTAVAAIGAVALLGWTIGDMTLAAGGSGLVPMNPLTAVLFVVAAAGVVAARSDTPRARGVALGCGVVIAAVAAERVVAYLLGSDVALDRMLFRTTLAAAPIGPNRMAPNTAASFSAAGLALICVSTRRPDRAAADAFALISGFIGFLTLVGYAYRQAALQGLPTHIPMALNTAIAFGLLASALVCVRDGGGFVRVLASSGRGGVWARRLLPVAVLTPIGFGWLRLSGQVAGLYDTEFGVTLMAVATIIVLVGMIWRSARSLDASDEARAAAEQALQVSEERLRSILDNAPSIVFVKDLAGRMRFVNRRFEELFHLSRDEVEGRTDHELFPPAAAAVYRSNDLRVIESGAPLETEEEAILDDGAHTYISIKFPLRDSSGAITSVCGIATDITARKASEAETARLQARVALTNRLLAIMATHREHDVYAAVLEIACSVLVSHTGAFGYLDDDSALVCGASTGLREGDAHAAEAPNGDAPFAGTHQDLVPRGTWGALLRTAVAERRATYVNEPHALFDGASPAARSLVAPVVFDGATLGIIYVADRAKVYGENERALADTMAAAIAPALSVRLTLQREEAERRRADAELRRVNGELVASNTELEAFTYSVSHDLRAPLRAIDGFARILLEDHGESFDSDARRLMDVVSTNAREMGRLIDDLLALSRVGRKDLDPVRVDMTALARAVTSEILGVEHGREVAVHVADLPPASGDATLLRQVLANLIGNAVKFTRNTAGADVDVGARTDGDGTVEYFVRDNGAGFDMRYVDKVFQVFQRLHRADEFEGTGVGLAIVHRIVQRHGGRVWAEGKIGEGATFHFTLPVAEGGYDGRDAHPGS